MTPNIHATLKDIYRSGAVALTFPQTLHLNHCCHGCDGQEKADCGQELHRGVSQPSEREAPLVLWDTIRLKLGKVS
jgi:hypothetical protein